MKVFIHPYKGYLNTKFQIYSDPIPDHHLFHCRYLKCRRPWRRHVGDETHWASAENTQSRQRVSDNHRQTNVGDAVGEPTHHRARPFYFAEAWCFETRRQRQWWYVDNWWLKLLLRLQDKCWCDHPNKFTQCLLFNYSPVFVVSYSYLYYLCK